MSENVIDLAVQFQTDKGALLVMRRIRAVGNIADDLSTVLATLRHDEQRFLTALLVWRIEGGQVFPASDLLQKLPLLHSMSWSNIVSVAESLAEAGVIEVVPIEHDKEGTATRVGFVWKALDAAIEAAMQHADTPKIAGLDGTPLRR
jgi:hypothetical protein